MYELKEIKAVVISAEDNEGVMVKILEWLHSAGPISLHGIWFQHTGDTAEEVATIYYEPMEPEDAGLGGHATLTT